MSNQRLDVLFINPRVRNESESPAYGCLWMMGYLKEHGFTAKYFDGNVESPQKLISLLFRSPQIIGLTATSLSYPAARRLIPEIRRIVKKSSLIVLGGVHATHLPEQTWHENPEVDVIVRGPGFQALQIILESPEEYKNEIPLLLGNGTPLSCDQLPLPAWDQINLEQFTGNYPVLDKPSTTTFTSFGCPHRCAFCSLHYKRPLYRPIHQLITELVYLEKRGVREVFLYDDEFNLNQKHVFRVCEALMASGLHKRLSFKCQMRASEKLTDPSMLEVMREANFKILYWGIESGSQHVLDSIQKKLTVEESERAIRLAKELGFQNYGFFMVQNLGEAWIDVQLTAQYIQWNRKYLDYAQFTVATPYPGSQLYNMAIDGNWFLPEIMDAQGRVDFSKFNTHGAVMNTPWMSADEAKTAKEHLEQLFYSSNRGVMLRTGRKLPKILKRVVPKWIKARVVK